MAKPGPRPLPTKLKLLRGTARKKDLHPSEPRPLPVRPAAPRWLTKEALKLWRGLAPDLERLGLLTAIDGPAFALLVTHWALARQAAEALAKEGMTAIDERGLSRKHPLAQVLRDNSQALRQYFGEFGMTPSSRTGLHLPAMEGEEDEMDALLDRSPGSWKRGER